DADVVRVSAQFAWIEVRIRVHDFRRLHRDRRRERRLASGGVEIQRPSAMHLIRSALDWRAVDTGGRVVTENAAEMRRQLWRGSRHSTGRSTDTHRGQN